MERICVGRHCWGFWWRHDAPCWHIKNTVTESGHPCWTSGRWLGYVKNTSAHVKDFLDGTSSLTDVRIRTCFSVISFRIFSWWHKLLNFFLAMFRVKRTYCKWSEQSGLLMALEVTWTSASILSSIYIFIFFMEGKRFPEGCNVLIIHSKLFPFIRIHLLFRSNLELLTIWFSRSFIIELQLKSYFTNKVGITEELNLPIS